MNKFSTITGKQDLSSLKHTLEREDLRLFLDLHARASSHPKECEEPLIHLLEKYPQAPEIANLLSFVYLKLKQLKKAEELITASYHSHPHYLFAKINYADQCLRHNKPTLIPDIFSHQWSLEALYPERKTFHTSEVRGFYVVMGFYRMAIGDRTNALECYRRAVEADPRHPSIAPLEKKLFHLSLIKKWSLRLQKLALIFKKK